MLRFAANVERGAIAVSEGDALVWSLLCADEPRVTRGVFPVLSAARGTTVRVRVAPPFAYGPPAADFWTGSSRDLFLAAGCR